MDSFQVRDQRSRGVVSAFGDGVASGLKGVKIAEELCSFVTGSAARGEMTESSDIDLFIVTNGESSRRDEILVQAAIIRTMEASGFGSPSKDALFLALHQTSDLVENLGKAQDDYSNALTVRMLLLLESRPLYNEAQYEHLLRRVVHEYWRNYRGHEEGYLPFVLLNDIARYWRIILLNHEGALGGDDQSVHARRKYKSFKLRFSRVMTCHSMIVRLLAGTQHGKGVSEDEFLVMVRETPVERMQQVRGRAQELGIDEGSVDSLLALYHEYLSFRDAYSRDEATGLLDSPEGLEWNAKADEFGSQMFALIQKLGEHSRLYRYLVV